MATQIALTPEQEKAVIKSMFDFVIRTTDNSEKATPAELEILPEMTKMLVTYWSATD